MKLLKDCITFLLRILLLYIIFGLCRVMFYIYNFNSVGAISWSELALLLKGAFLFDSASIFYINMPFLFLSLLPFKFRARSGYQKMLAILFVSINAIGLTINVTDIFYYPFKLARIASDDLYLTQGGNFISLVFQFLKDYWYGFLLFAGIVWLLWWGFKRIPYHASDDKRWYVYYPSQLILYSICMTAAVFLIRGATFEHGTYPISVSDASLYATPQKSSLILSNPFAFIRTFSERGNAHYEKYFSDQELNEIYTPTYQVHDSVNEHLRPNIVLIIMESFGSAHIKALNSEFPADNASYTPFLDSLINDGFIFTNIYQNTLRSIDALPALWASIPSFKSQFLSMPQSAAPMFPLPAALGELGYTSAFMHGANREAMSFVAFGKASGVENFVTREDYESQVTTDNYDGNWGIFDHFFLPYCVDKMSELKAPFFSTIFTMSSHHPYTIPDEYKNRFSKGTMDIHEAIGYSDMALKMFFDKASKQPWFNHTIFVITADHNSGADTKKYLTAPYNYAVPLLFYSPMGYFKGSSDVAGGQIDLMPTILKIVDYPKPVVAFGSDLFDHSHPHRAINYFGGSFNTMTDSLIYIFNQHDVTAIYNYRKDPLQTTNLVGDSLQNNDDINWTKAFIQQYYTHLKERSYTTKPRK